MINAMFIYLTKTITSFLSSINKNYTMKNKLLIVGLCVGMALVSCKGKDDSDGKDTITTVDSSTIITDTTTITTDTGMSGSSGSSSGTTDGTRSTLGPASSTTATGSGSGSAGSPSGGTVSGSGAKLDNSNPSAAGTTKSGINNDNTKGGTGAPKP